MSISSIVVGIANGEEESDGDNDDVPKPSIGFTKNTLEVYLNQFFISGAMGGLDWHRLAKIKRMNHCMNGIKYLGLFELPCEFVQELQQLEDLKDFKEI